MNKNTVMVIFALLYGAACKEHHHAETHSHDAAAAVELTLNAGKKWQADGITRTTFGQLQKEVAGARIADANAAEKFTDAQDKQIAALLQGCTMKGAAHEQLHILIGKTNSALMTLRKAKAEALPGALAQLKATVDLYSTYFE